jgi:hypothetical protein
MAKACMMAKLDAEHNKLVPLFETAGLKLPKVYASDWEYHNSNLDAQIDEDNHQRQGNFSHGGQLEAVSQKNAMDAAEIFYCAHHAKLP